MQFRAYVLEGRKPHLTPHTALLRRRRGRVIVVLPGTLLLLKAHRTIGLEQLGCEWKECPSTPLHPQESQSAPWRWWELGKDQRGTVVCVMCMRCPYQTECYLKDPSLLRHPQTNNMTLVGGAPEAPLLKGVGYDQSRGLIVSSDAPGTLTVLMRRGADRLRVSDLRHVEGTPIGWHNNNTAAVVYTP